MSLLEKGVLNSESRFITRVLRMTSCIRRKLTQNRLENIISLYLGSKSNVRSLLLSSLNSQMMNLEDKSQDAIPEQEIYLGFLCVLFHQDNHELENGLKLSLNLVTEIKKFNRRTLDQLAAKILFHLNILHESQAKIPRKSLFELLQTAVLRQDTESTATLINILLRSLLKDNLVDQAEKLVAKSKFPEYASNNQTARYMYYLGRIKAIHLDYTGSYHHLQVALRKAPQSQRSSGFLQATTKLLVIVQLLMGEIPDRITFKPIHLRQSLASYKKLVTAVRNGDLNLFQSTLAMDQERFVKDKTLTLIQRLHHNVIKTGIRLISLSYSCISLRDICIKLALDSEEDAEYMVAKAIRDGVIDATIDHVNGHVRSKEIIDVYSTREPLAAFHQRIAFCLELHNESVKAMRYPSNVHKVFSDVEELRDLEKDIQQHLEEEHEHDAF